MLFPPVPSILKPITVKPRAPLPSRLVPSSQAAAFAIALPLSVLAGASIAVPTALAIAASAGDLGLSSLTAATSPPDAAVLYLAFLVVGLAFAERRVFAGRSWQRAVERPAIQGPALADGAGCFLLAETGEGAWYSCSTPSDTPGVVCEQDTGFAVDEWVCKVPTLR